jgi:hypothetical protein
MKTSVVNSENHFGKHENLFCKPGILGNHVDRMMLSSRFACTESFSMCLQTYQSHPHGKMLPKSQERALRRSQKIFSKFDALDFAEFGVFLDTACCISSRMHQLGLHSSRSLQHALFQRPKIQKIVGLPNMFSLLPLLFKAACLLLTTTIVLKTAVI